MHDPVVVLLLAGCAGGLAGLPGWPWGRRWGRRAALAAAAAGGAALAGALGAAPAATAAAALLAALDAALWWRLPRATGGIGRFTSAGAAGLGAETSGARSAWS